MGNALYCGSEILFFRWGGDEFFVIMIGLDSKTAYSRMDKMEKMLTNVRIEGINKPITIGVSHAFEDFADLRDLEATIQLADEGMYRQKQKRKGLAAEAKLPPPVLTEMVENLVGKY